MRFDRIANLRGSKNWTQQELADEMGIARQYVNRIEKGKIKKLTRQMMFKLATAFEMPIEELEKWIT